MREILFRGFARKANGSKIIEINGEKIRGQWIYWNACGDLVDKSNTKIEWFKFCLPDGRPHDLNMIVSVAAFGLLVKETIGQYTGLTDKNHRKIFEGDICRFREWSKGDMCWVGKVHYEHQQFVISGNPNKECESPFLLIMSRFIPENIEVIGNTHENKD